MNVSNQRNEFVKDFLVSHEKVRLSMIRVSNLTPMQLSVVIHELLVLEVWRQNVLPLILSRYSSRAKASFPTYIVVSVYSCYTVIAAVKLIVEALDVFIL